MRLTSCLENIPLISPKGGGRPWKQALKKAHHLNVKCTARMMYFFLTDLVTVVGMLPRQQPPVDLIDYVSKTLVQPIIQW